MLESGRFYRVLDLADSVISGGMRNPRILGQKAQALGALGRMDEAVELFEEALVEDYESCENHLNFAVVLMRMGKTGRAVTEFCVAKRFCSGKNMSVIHRNLAVANIKLGKNDLAFNMVREGIELNPGDPYLMGLKGMLIAESSPAEAESLFTMLQRAGDVAPEFLFQFGLLLLRTGRSSRAVEVLETAARARPGDDEVQFVFAEALDRADRSGEAETVLRSLSGRGSDGEVRRKLAGVIFRQGRFREAFEIYEKLQRTPEIMDRMAMCLHGLGNLDEALSWEREALDARPDWTVAMLNMAVILAARGELEEAASILKRVLGIDPDNMTARINLDRLRRAGKETEQ